MRIKAVATTVLIAFSPFIAHSLENNEENKALSHLTFKAVCASEGADHQPQSYGSEPSDFSSQGLKSPVRSEPPKPQPKSQQPSSLQYNPPSSADYR